MSPNLAHWVSSWNLISFYAHEKSHKNCFERYIQIKKMHFIFTSKFWTSFFTLIGLALFSAESQAFGGSWGGAWSFCGSVWIRHCLAPDSVRWHTLVPQCTCFSFFALYYCFPFVLLFFPIYSGFYCIIHKKKIKNLQKIIINEKFSVLVSNRFYLETPHKITRNQLYCYNSIGLGSTYFLSTLISNSLKFSRKLLV